MQRRLENSRALLIAHSAHLDALSPLRVLARGYAVARDEQGRILKRVAQLPDGKEFRLRVTDGEVPAQVKGS
jgi:exodeoxyribonuclease VII large subunit